MKQSLALNAVLVCLIEVALVGSDSVSYEDCLADPDVISEAFCLPKGYRKDVPPSTIMPIGVYVNLPLSEISAIDDQHSQISIRLSYKLLWPEPRMVLNTSIDWNTVEEKPVAASLIRHFWTPDIIIHDLVEFKKPEVIKEVAALQIKKEHSVYFKIRSDLTVVCKGMEFALYPFDSHVCHLKLTSFSHDTNEMILNGGYTYNQDNQRALPFKVAISRMKDSDVYRGHNSNYSMFALEIRLRRYVSPYILSCFLPTGIFVVVSWVSFLIPADIIAARIVLLVTLVLVLINKFNYVTERIPVARQETALEFWVSACICLVFAALGEYAFILWKMTRLRRQEREYNPEAHQSSWPQVPANGEVVGLRFNGGHSLQLQKSVKLPTVAMIDRHGVRNQVAHRHQRLTSPVVTSPINVRPQGLDLDQSSISDSFIEYGAGFSENYNPSLRGHDEVNPARNSSHAKVHWKDPFWKDSLEIGDRCQESRKPGQTKQEEEFARKRKKYLEDFDEHALKVYPSLFLTFNVIYWFYYMFYCH
ncbi:hypothetical protein TCAL_13054 [Tigriopus californicus]|uniref:Neurotransmitter-gated ion-channel ligand-binding domain-containing protein n=1 Tax=Tigriopus californicus TaxID=6832 RepID=A0A553PSX4_TIGCA|nr:glutamate-gated chloride channel subunit beta-like [Tigriopus californicus]XP_059097053.1 glutamate-gated chloride channel subunit beta-like [Tigriopus californicus]TRY80782.1 hypothetical protein TCAL_13054 [Tigriopus californicus]|eukprot:TCALIF_13054-PA protein Name:"Similar to GLRB Glycine receptor subunit beta (Bos taurus)" AED:0.10 eAED:0.10 QI:65/1/1/1/0.87/0.88/9/95/531